MFSLFMSSSSDEEDSSHTDMCVTNRELHSNINVMDMPNNEFQNNFRMNKETFSYILSEISPYFKKTCRVSAVSKETKLATTLRFLGTGSYQKGIGNEFVASLSQSKVCEVISECSVAMEQSLCPKWIKFNLSSEEELDVKSNFFEKFGIPGVIGCVDGTHIKIMPPKENVRHLYYNRDGYYSLNTMLICDSNLVITYVDSRHPGGNDDAFIWSFSAAEDHLNKLFLNGKSNTWLIGDGGYQCLPYLLTPYRNPKTESQIKFNTVLNKARNTVDRCIGLLKNRFKCLIGERGLHYSEDKAKTFINVCCALHNICIFYKNEWPQMDETENVNENLNVVQESDVLVSSAAQNIRDGVANYLL